MSLAQPAWAGLKVRRAFPARERLKDVVRDDVSNYVRRPKWKTLPVTPALRQAPARGQVRKTPLNFAVQGLLRTTKAMILPHRTLPAFWIRFDSLPKDVQKLARAAYNEWTNNPRATGLRFKHLGSGIYSARIGEDHRAVCRLKDGA
jgi:hypothetical protein